MYPSQCYYVFIHLRIILYLLIPLSWPASGYGFMRIIVCSYYGQSVCCNFTSEINDYIMYCSQAEFHINYISSPYLSLLFLSNFLSLTDSFNRIQECKYTWQKQFTDIIFPIYIPEQCFPIPAVLWWSVWPSLVKRLYIGHLPLWDMLASNKITAQISLVRSSCLQSGIAIYACCSPGWNGAQWTWLVIIVWVMVGHPGTMMV